MHAMAETGCPTKASAGSFPNPTQTIVEATTLHQPGKSTTARPSQTNHSAKRTHPKCDLAHDENYLQIRNVDRMSPFLMSVVSDSDFWLFVGSNGGFTAGRVDPDHAIFPYQTVDKILAQPKAGGALCLVECDGVLWEPWVNDCPTVGITRNLYKHVAGTSVIFEEVNDALGLVMRWKNRYVRAVARYLGS